MRRQYQYRHADRGLQWSTVDVLSQMCHEIGQADPLSTGQLWGFGAGFISCANSIRSMQGIVYGRCNAPSAKGWGMHP